ncbi:hypothetical protein G7054_g9143 [Neopestalotiopsis clavispora]|nr:hypothetical protein G7054_g9143 [Neopestalotiopsis clavispora]
MRNSLFARSRQIGGGLCDACKQQHRQRRALNIASSPRAATAARHAPSSPRTSTLNNTLYQSARPLSTSRTLRTESTANATAQAESEANETTRSAPPPPQTHYDFFPDSLPQGPPPSGPFSIDVRTLRREFLQLQSRAHPDLHPQHLKSRAEATSARINEAFRTLSNPLLRAQYLLSLNYGLDVAADETAKVDDPELLLEVLEAREQIEDAADESELEPLKAANAVREEESVAELERAFAAGDLEAAVRECVKLRYWVNIRESIDNWEQGKPVVLEH